MNGYLEWGILEPEEVMDFLRRWNLKHKVQAILFMGKIRTFDPDRHGWVFEKLKHKYGLRL